MKKTFVMALAVFSALMMSSCRSSRTLSGAQAVADPAAQAVQEVNPIIYTQPTHTQTPSTPAAAPTPQPGDRSEAVTVVDQSQAGLLRSYNVVVGAFGVKANADAFRNLMASRGYNAFLVQNAQGLYRVVAGGYDNRQQAITVRDQIRANYSSDDPNTTPKAWILIPVR